MGAHAEASSSTTITAVATGAAHAQTTGQVAAAQTTAHESVAFKSNAAAEPTKTNHTGLPDTLKSGVENLSGHSMDDVKVHYNSDKPAQVNALAYARGKEIHLASGQEKHLPHEAWHVVQQKQGKVKPTTQFRKGVQVNDDPGLEKEAHVMGAKAVSNREPVSDKLVKSKSSPGDTFQLIRNDSASEVFFPLKNISVRDAENYYLYHGTFESNLTDIGLTGLDPAQGGGGKGAARYEKVRSADSTGMIKYATDPNIAMVYAKEPALMVPPHIGIFLEARVKRQNIRGVFNDKTARDERSPFWRRERGGENFSRARGLDPTKLALNEQGDPGAGNPILAVETNQPVEPKDIKLIGIYLPARAGEVDESKIESKLNHKKEAVAIDMTTFKSKTIYQDSWLNK